MKKTVFLAVAFTILFSVCAFAVVETKFYGFQWLRYDMKIVGSGQDSALDTSSFYIPRTYLRWKFTDADLGFEGNLTVDINNDKSGQEVTVTAAAGNLDWAAFIKHGYIVLKKIPYLSDAGISLKIGQQPTYFGVIDTWWSPIIERSIEDIRGVISAADQGIALDGTIPSGYGNYQVGLYNGCGYRKIEDNTEKMALARVIVTPIKEAYLRLSYFRNITSAFGLPAAVTSASDLVLGGNYGPVDGFVEYVVRSAASLSSSLKSGVSVGYSAYLNYQIIDPLAFLIRYDNWNADTKAANDEKNVYIAGFNIKIAGELALLQLNYELEQPMYGGADNINTWEAQVKWSW